MHAQDRPILKLVDGSGQFIIPKFQRPYRWNDEQCLTLLEDVEQAASFKDGERHFLGSIVHRPLDNTVIGFTKSLLIDGQQRLTTITLILCALREMSDDDPRRRGKIGDWLVNRNERGSGRYKLDLRDADRKALRHVIDRASPEDGDTGTVARRYRALRKALESRDPERILQGLDHTCYVEVVLGPRDNHQAIFESLNAKFEPLSLLDKVRNFALMGLDEDEMTSLWDGDWRVIEERYGGEDEDRHKAGAFGLLARDLLALAGPRERRRNEDAYASIKNLARHLGVHGGGLGDGRARFVSDLAGHAKHHAAFTLGVDAPDGLGEALAKCRRLSDTPGPVVLRLLGALEAKTLSVKDVQGALQTIESVLVRRRCCGRGSGGERNAFARIGRVLKPRCTPDDVNRVFSQVMHGGRRPPDDTEFTEALLDRAMPRGGPLVRHVLVGLENFGRDEVVTKRLTIEHVLPQTRNLVPDWKQMLGEGWEETHARCVQRLGNLTLTAYNPELGARPLREKQEHEHGYQASKAVWLNSDLRDAETWNEASIAARGRRMAERALQIWPRLEGDAGEELDPLELDPGAGGPILTANDGPRAWRRRGDSCWMVEQNGVQLQRAVVAALLRLDRRGPDVAARSHHLVVGRSGERAYVDIGQGIEGSVYKILSAAGRREWLEEFADGIEKEDGSAPSIGAPAEPGDVDLWLPTWHSGGPGEFPQAKARREAVEASVNRSGTLRVSDRTLVATLDRRAWRTRNGQWQVCSGALATISSLARWLAHQDRHGPAAFYAACPWHFTRGVAGRTGAEVVDVEHDVMLLYKHLGTHRKCRDSAWRLCRQVQAETGGGIRLGEDVELWMPDKDQDQD